MSESVKISNDGQTVEHKSNAGVSTSDGLPGKVVPLTQQNAYESQTSRLQVNANGDYIEDNQRVTKIQLDAGGSSSALPDELGTLQDENGNPLSNLQAVTGSCSIVLNGARVRIDVAERCGLIARDNTGALLVPDQEAMAKAAKNEPEKKALHQTESLKTEADQTVIDTFNQRGSERMTDAFIGRMIDHAVEETDSAGTTADFQQGVGAANPNEIHAFTENYLGSLINAGIDYAVRASKGTVTSAQVEAKIHTLSKGYVKQLLLSLHFNNLRAAKELIRLVKTGEGA